MQKVKFLPIFILLSALVVMTTQAEANSREGKQIFREYCKSCHVRNGSAPEFAPSSKTQSQWRRFFRRDKHKKAPELWEKMGEDDKKSIWYFFYENALDADRPETCG